MEVNIPLTNWFRFLSGTVRVRVRCAVPERVLNLCAREGLPVWEARCPDPCTLTAVIPAPQLERFKAIAAKCGGEVTHGAARGLPRVRRLAQRRRFVLMLLALVSALVLFSSAFLWEIRVTGNETVPTGEILRALDECGFSCGKCWLWFQSQALQSELLYRLPQLEWVSFQIRGSRADVIVYEAETAPEVIDNDEPVDLVAAHGGVIVRMTVLQGQPEVQRGDYVEPGQTLVSGLVSDRLGGVRTAHALGSVRARTDWEITAALPKTALVRTPTGRAKRRYALLFGKNRLNFGQTSGIPDADCDIMYHEMVCAIPGVFRLPVSILCETRQPIIETPRARTAQEARGILEQTLRRTLVGRIGPDGEIMDLHFTPGETEDAFLLTLRAECEQEITTERKPTHDRTDDTG